MTEEERRDLLKRAMSEMGKMKSEKKSNAARINGARGGRPPKPKPESPSQSETP